MRWANTLGHTLNPKFEIHNFALFRILPTLH